MKALTPTNQEKQAALKLVIDGCLFAPSTSALAKRLGYKGKTSLYRIQQEEASDKAVEEAWDKLVAFTDCTEETLFAAARAVGYCRNFKRVVKEEGGEVVAPENHHKWVLTGVMKGDSKRFSEKFQREVWPEMTDLRREDTEAFWMMMALYYFDEAGVMAYEKDFNLLETLNALHELLRKNFKNNEQARGCVSNTFRKDYIDSCGRGCVWDLLLFGGVALMHYAEPKVLSLMAQSYTLYNFGDNSYWITPDSVYREGTRVWHLIEVSIDGGTHGFYFAIELKVGRNKEEFEVTQIIPMLFSENSDQLQMEVTQERKLVIASYEWNDGYTELRIKATKEQHAHYSIPTLLERIDLTNPEGKEEKIWANVMIGYDKNIPDNVLQTICEFDGIEYLNEYEIRNVTIDWHALTISVEKDGESTDYTISIQRYDFLKTLLPSDTIGVVHLKRTDQLSFRWVDKAYVIPMAEFEVKANL